MTLDFDDVKRHCPERQSLLAKHTVPGARPPGYGYSGCNSIEIPITAIILLHTCENTAPCKWENEGYIYIYIYLIESKCVDDPHYHDSYPKMCFMWQRRRTIQRPKPFEQTSGQTPRHMLIDGPSQLVQLHEDSRQRMEFEPARSHNSYKERWDMRWRRLYIYIYRSSMCEEKDHVSSYLPYHRHRHPATTKRIAITAFALTIATPATAKQRKMLTLEKWDMWPHGMDVIKSIDW